MDEKMDRAKNDVIAKGTANDALGKSTKDQLLGADQEQQFWLNRTCKIPVQLQKRILN